MKEASETSNKVGKFIRFSFKNVFVEMKTFEQNLREEFSCVIKKKLSKSIFFEIFFFLFGNSYKAH